MEESLFHAINQQWTSPALDLCMAGLSDSQIWMPFLIAIGISALVFGGFKARALVICLGISLAIAGLVTSALKSSVARHRPKHVQSVRMVQLQKARPKFFTLFKKPTIRFSDSSDRTRSGPSFPSGHTVNNTIAATYCTLFTGAAAGCTGLSLWLLDIREFTWARIGPPTWRRRSFSESARHCFCSASLS